MCRTLNHYKQPASHAIMEAEPISSSLKADFPLISLHEWDDGQHCDRQCRMRHLVVLSVFHNGMPTKVSGSGTHAPRRSWQLANRSVGPTHSRDGHRRTLTF